MSDQQQTLLHKWEIVSQGENATTYRMRVPGGWLYRYQSQRSVCDHSHSGCLEARRRQMRPSVIASGNGGDRRTAALRQMTAAAVSDGR
jgi:hypothetical protein